MKGFEGFVTIVVLAATVLALVYRDAIGEIVLPIIYRIF
jgi:hypothetical protein